MNPPPSRGKALPSASWSFANFFVPQRNKLLFPCCNLCAVSHFTERRAATRGIAAFIRADSCPARAYACSFTRAGQFCHNGEKYAAETREPSRGNNSKLTETEGKRKRDDTFERASFTRKCHARLNYARPPFASRHKPRGMSLKL